MKHNYDLSQRIHGLENDITLLQDQKEALSYGIEYYKTDSFREREARAKLGLQLPGENVIILPHAAPEADVVAPKAEEPAKKLPNYRQWFNFLAGRS